MTYEAPIEFTVTPYHEEQPASSRLVRTSSDSVRAVVWLAATGASVLAPFLAIQRITLVPQEGDSGLADVSGGAGPVASGREVMSVNGWGQAHLSPAPQDFSNSAGGAPRYGVLFCVCAGLFLLAALWQLMPRWRTRWVAPSAPGLAGSFLLVGSVVTLATELISESKRSTGSSITYGAGIGLYLVATAAIVGLLPAIHRYWQDVSAMPASSQPMPEQEMELATVGETSFAGRDAVRDLGTSPF